MANSRTTVPIERGGYVIDKSVTTMARFTIDTVSVPFVFHDIIPKMTELLYHQVTWSGYVKMKEEDATGRIMIGNHTFNITDTWQKLSWTFQPYSSHFAYKFLDNGIYDFACNQLETGNKPSDYSCSNADMTTMEEIISEISQTSSSISTAIKNLTNGRFTTIEQNVTGLTTRVGTAEGDITTLEQTTSGLDIRVTSAEGDITTIEAKMDGITVTTSGGTTLVKGGSIKTGIISDLAGNFVLNMDTGSLVMQNGTFSGKVTSTEGSIGDWKLDDKLLYSSTSDNPCSATNTSKQTVALYSYDESYVGATQPAILVRKELWNADTSTVDSTTPFYISYDGHLVSDYGYIGGLTLQNNVMSAYADNSNKVFSASVNGVTMQDVSGQKSTSLANNLLTMTSATSTSKLAPTYLSIVLSDTSTPIASVQLDATYGGSYGRFVSYESKGDSSVGVYDHTNGKWMHVSVDTGDGNGYQYLRSPRRISFITDVVSISDGIDILKDESDDILKIRPKVTNQAYCGSSTLAWAKMYTYASPSPSDRKVKNVSSNHNWKIDDFIMGLEPVVYKYKGENHKRLHMGFIAQDVKQLCDELELGDLGVYMADYIDERAEYNGEDVSDSELRWSLCYQEFISPIILELQRLMNRVSELEERLGE